MPILHFIFTLVATIKNKYSPKIPLHFDDHTKGDQKRQEKTEK